MSLPAEVLSHLVTVHGQWCRTSDGAGYTGKMVFVASPIYLEDVTSEITFVPDVETVEFTTEAGGMWTVDLIPTNLGTLNPTGWTWQASVSFTGPLPLSGKSPEPFSFPVPDASDPIPLTSILPGASPAGGSYVLLPGGPIVVSPDAGNLLEQRLNGVFATTPNYIGSVGDTEPDTSDWAVDTFWYDTSNEG